MQFEDSHSSSSTFGLAGWIFADLMLILVIIFMASQFVATPDDTPFHIVQGTPVVDYESFSQTATAQTNELAQQESAHATEMAKMSQTATAQADNANEADEAQATEMASLSQTATAQADQESVRATEMASLSQTATVQAEQDAVRATEQAAFSETATAQASMVQTATVQNEVIANLEATIDASVIRDADAVYQEHTFMTDISGLLGGTNPAAEEDARESIRAIMTPYAECRVWQVQTFGRGNADYPGAELARQINDMMKEEFPLVFASLVYEDGFINLIADDPVGQVDIRLYFLGPCVPQEAAVVQPGLPQSLISRGMTGVLPSGNAHGIGAFSKMRW